MLQSIKRAFRLNSSNPELHSCLVRFQLKLVTLRKQTDPIVDEPVLTVLNNEIEPILRGRSAAQINDEFLAKNSNSLPCLFEGNFFFKSMICRQYCCKFRNSLAIDSGPWKAFVDHENSSRAAQYFSIRKFNLSLKLSLIHI